MSSYIVDCNYCLLFFGNNKKKIIAQNGVKSFDYNIIHYSARTFWKGVLVSKFWANFVLSRFVN